VMREEWAGVAGVVEWWSCGEVGAVRLSVSL
jgi:hypothetical protein